ncbi:uncharacterized protein LOC104439853 [Eucalyptus grandis]|uniref:uncharacterized protein LOC104439853 n=1 Tax=Eucalyptus grandis TaxID=71139 RepID=UPI00192ECEEC|nr:uncharacterized protein LOC104439853 [Eucalyptus grandis]
MVAKDEWVKTAMAEDGMVAELLVRLKQEPRCAPAPPHPPSSSAAAAAVVASASGSPLPPPRWGIRQPRSRIAFRCDAGSPAKRCGDSARNSPTTPLSWSAASSSGTADGVCDDSNLQFCGSSSTSKVIASSDSGTPDLKKSRKRKTFAELKEEEGLLLKERVHLNKEIATLRATFKEQSTRNESLKKMKHDVDMNTTKIATISVTCEPEKANSNAPEKANSNAHGVEAPSTVDHAALTLPMHVASPSRSSDSQQRCGSPEKQSASFLLPDLNMMPSEDDPLSEALKGMSSGETLETLQVCVN